MRGLFIPEITAEMFRNGSLESIEALMAEGEIYDIDYQQPCEDAISRTEALRLIDEERQHLLSLNMDGAEHIIVHYARRIIEDMPSASSVDCIDRQKTIAEIQYKYYDNAIGIDIVDMIAHMPAAIPEQLGEHFAEGYKKGIENE